MERYRTVDDEEEGGGERLRERKTSSRGTGVGLDGRNRRRTLLIRETGSTGGADCVLSVGEEGEGSTKTTSRSSDVSDSESALSSSSSSSVSVHGLSSRLGSGSGAKRMRGWRDDRDEDEDEDEEAECMSRRSVVGWSRIDEIGRAHV